MRCTKVKKQMCACVGGGQETHISQKKHIFLHMFVKKGGGVSRHLPVLLLLFTKPPCSLSESLLRLAVSEPSHSEQNQDEF